jgi:hypothetical protein
MFNSKKWILTGEDFLKFKSYCKGSLLMLLVAISFAILAMIFLPNYAVIYLGSSIVIAIIVGIDIVWEYIDIVRYQSNKDESKL